MNKKRIIRISIFLLIAVVVGIIFAVNSQGTYSTYDVTSAEAEADYNFLQNDFDSTRETNTYYDYIKDADISYGDTDLTAALDSTASTEIYDYKNLSVSILDYDESAQYSVSVTKAGYYNISLDYYVIGRPLSNYQVKVAINNKYLFDEAEHISVPINWEDETKSFPLDSYGDQTISPSLKIDQWTNISLYDNQFSTSTPLLFYFEAGLNDISVTLISSNGSLGLGDLSLKSQREINAYSTYISNYPNSDIATDEEIYINAISYTEKNSSFIRLSNYNNAVASPYSNTKDMLNIVDGDSWTDSGQAITYDINCTKTGLYTLSLHYRNSKNEYSVFRSVSIDGEVPFNELLDYELPYTGSSYDTLTLGDGTSPYKVYLTEGSHQLKLTAEVSPLTKSLNELQVVVDHINQLSLEVLKITGTDIDEDRTWDIIKYIPMTSEFLNAYDTILKNCANNLAKYSDKGINSSTISFLNRSINMLKEIKSKPEKLPLYLDKLYSGTSSINQLIGDVMESLEEQPISLESIYFESNKDAPVVKSNVAENIVNGATQLGQTFFSDKYHNNTDDTTLNVWVNKPITYIDVMQKLLDSDYNLSHSPKVKLSAMPDQSKLTMSIAADNSPDVVLGVQSYVPYDLAIRGGVYDLTNFSDFYTVAERFVPGSLVSYVISDEDGDRVYGIPESLNFNVLAYRSDIFSSLGISADINTWDDAKGILSVLQRYGMNFYLPISADNSTKWFYQTSPMLLQAGGSLYSSDGLSVAVNSEASVKGLETLTKMFTNNSLPTSVPSFYSQFRNGTLPIGVLDFSTYLMLKNAAPEITGKWSITEPLGTTRYNDDGTSYIDRTYITSGTSGAIMQSSQYKDESWDFLKWWTSEEIQSEFAYNLQSTYGPEYLWLSSNLNAVKNSQIEEEDKKVILKSLDWVVDVNRNPGQYIVERGVSNIWTAAVLSGDPLRVKIENETITMNREIKRKMVEFGYIDESGNVLKEFYMRDAEWMIEQIKKYGGTN